MDENAILTPYAGITYDVSDKFSIYASYTDIFKPQTVKDSSGAVLAPVVGANFEAGVKGELYDGRLNLAAAVFLLQQDNLSQRDDSIPFNTGNICGGYCYFANGRVTSKGIDLSINGELSPYLSIGGGYTYVDATYDTGANKGNRYNTNTPKHSIRLFASYHIPGTGLTLGGNFSFQSKIFQRSGTVWRIEQGSYALASLFAKYDISDHAEISAGINNVFDKAYLTPQTPTTNFYGDPRNGYVRLRYRF